MISESEFRGKYNKKNGVMPLFYWGDLFWLKYLIDNQSIVVFSLVQTYRKQRNFNRTYIIGGNGLDLLTIPVSYEGMFPELRVVRISYKEDWRKNHLKKIYYAYKNAAYFDFYWQNIEKLYQSKFEYLWEFNFEVFQFLQSLLNLSEIRTTLESIPQTAFSYRIQETPPNIIFPEYFQLFNTKFRANVSSLDLIMNLGPESKNYIKNIYLNYSDIDITKKKIHGKMK